jgi:hypothetical protein
MTLYDTSTVLHRKSPTSDIHYPTQAVLHPNFYFEPSISMKQQEPYPWL